MFSTHLCTTKKWENIQNISLFGISISVFFQCLFYNIKSNYDENYKNNTTSFDVFVPLVGIHAFVDLFITKSNDLKLHHVFILSILFYNYYYGVVSEDKFNIVYTLLKTEISSIFYVLKYWLPKSTNVYFVNNLLFYFFFFKFRIYDFYHGLITNHYQFELLFEKYSSNRGGMR